MVKEFSIKYKEFVFKLIRYLLVRGLGVVLYAGIIVVLVEYLNINATVSSIISFVTLSLILYILSYTWVFNYEGSHTESFPKFIATELITLLLNTFIMYIVVDYYQQPYQYGIAATTLIIPVTNLILNFFWSFK